MEGLKNISRERVWLEMQKIVVGNHASEILIKMESIGLFPYIDLGKFRLRFDKFKRVHETGDLQKMRGVTILSYLFDQSDDFSNIRKSWKMSNDEDYIGQFIKKYQNAFPCDSIDSTFKYFKDLLVDTPKHCNHKVMMALRELSYSETATFGNNLFDKIHKWEVPEYPVKGTDLIKEFDLPKGPLIQKYLTKGKTKWKDEYYCLDRKDILDFIRKDIKKFSC